MTFAVLHVFPCLENDPPKFRDFPGPVSTLQQALAISYACISSQFRQIRNGRTIGDENNLEVYVKARKTFLNNFCDAGVMFKLTCGK